MACAARVDEHTLGFNYSKMGLPKKSMLMTFANDELKPVLARKIYAKLEKMGKLVFCNEMKFLAVKKQGFFPYTLEK
jgi:hypothetical protein